MAATEEMMPLQSTESQEGTKLQIPKDDIETTKPQDTKPRENKDVETTMQNAEEEQTGSCHFIALSDAGKPIFSTFPEEHDLAKTCGLIQAIRTTLTDPRSRLGDIQSMRSQNVCIVMMAVGAITLVGVSFRSSQGTWETEAFLRLGLEYIYSQIIFTFTQQIQVVFAQNPSYDLREAIGASDGVIQGFLDRARTEAGRLMLGAVETVRPLRPDFRYKASLVLHGVCKRVDNTVYALLLADDKLLTIVQPTFAAHQLRPSDLTILLNFIASQPGLTNSELWFPVCLPRFNSSGFLYTYTSCLDEETKLSLVLISQLNSTEQFELFRKESDSVRRELGLPSIIGTVLRIVERELSASASNFDDVAWKRTGSPDLQLENDKEEEEFNPSHRRHSITIPERNETLLGEDSPPFDMCPLLTEIKHSMDPAKNAELVKHYLTLSETLHFIFRFDTSILSMSTKGSTKPCGTFTQCFCPPIGFPFVDETSRREVWATYQKLSLRIRLGSASPEVTFEALHQLARRSEEDMSPRMMEKHSLAMRLAEEAPELQGLSYVLADHELFMAMNGRGFEL